MIWLLILLGCAPSGSNSAPPNLVLISIDTTRSDHVGTDAKAATPHLNEIAAKGTRFTRATTVSNNTLPAHISMLSGQMPQKTGVPRNGFKLSSSTQWLPTILQSAGWQTAAFVSASALSGNLGLSRGFDEFDDATTIKEIDQRQRRGASTVSAATNWIEQPHETPYFLWVHLFDPHYPYTPPSPFNEGNDDYSGPADGSMEYLMGVWGRGRPKVATTAADRAQLNRLYAGEVSYLDTQIGRLTTALLREDPNTLIVISADHGESLTEHDYLYDHGEYLYQPTVHIPLIVRPPETWPVTEKESEALAQTTDVFPTLLNAAQLSVPADTDGRNLLPALTDTISLRDVAFSESCRPWQIEKRHKNDYQNLWKATMALQWPHKLIVTPYQDATELYDLNSDPEEKNNIAESHPDVVDSLASAIEDWRGNAITIGRPDPENMEQIKALGYIE